MKKIIITIIVLMLTISMQAKKTQQWTSEDATSETTCYEYETRKEIYADFGRRGWAKDEIVWLKSLDNGSVIVSKTTDNKWSVVIIKKK